jgi:RHS repeat-associated protein
MSYKGSASLGPTVNRQIQYDATGNRVEDSVNGAGTFIGNAIVSDSIALYASDTDGFGNLSRILNLQSESQQTLTYRVDEKLASFQGQSKLGEIQAEYAYDALGRRVAKNVAKNSQSISQSFAYLGDQDKILIGRNGQGSLTVYLDGVGIDEHLGAATENGATAYVTDHLGSVLNGAVSGALQTFGAFGEELGNSMQISETTDPTAYGYVGRQLDPESGTYYYRARVYNPSIGRWMQPDPIGFASNDTNLFRYVSNNPIVMLDPAGECGISTLAPLILPDSIIPETGPEWPTTGPGQVTGPNITPSGGNPPPPGVIIIPGGTVPDKPFIGPPAPPPATSPAPAPTGIGHTVA